jgi:hypothetical protein
MYIVERSFFRKIFWILSFVAFLLCMGIRAVARPIIGGRGYSYIRVLPDGFLLQYVNMNI